MSFRNPKKRLANLVQKNPEKFVRIPAKNLNASSLSSERVALAHNSLLEFLIP